MEKLKLTPEQKIIFQKALHDAYKAGDHDATFLFGGMLELIEGEVERLKKVTADYCE